MLEEFTSRWDIMIGILMGVSLYGFMSVVMIDYNWGSGLSNAFAIIYVMTLGRVFSAEDLGVKGLLYFGLFILSFLALNRKKAWIENILETLGLGSAMVVLFEVGVFAYTPYFIDKWAIQDFYGTPFQYFTNIDLLITAAVLLVASQTYLKRKRSKFLPK